MDAMVLALTDALRGLAPANQQPPTQKVRLTAEPPVYGGPADGSSPNQFLEDLTRYQLVVGCTDADLLERVLPLSLRDSAGRWFDFAGPFQTLMAFRVAFKSEFLASDYERRLLVELDRRTQGPDEPLTQYIHCIAEYYKRLGGNVPDSDKVERVIRQSHPAYRTHLQGKAFATLAELAVEAKKLQSNLLACQLYLPPPHAAYSIEPSLAYTGAEPQVYAPTKATGTGEYSLAATNIVGAAKNTIAAGVTSFPLGMASLDPFLYHRFKNLEQQYAASLAQSQVRHSVQRTEEPKKGESKNYSSRSQFQSSSGCWKCGKVGHIKRNCPKN